MQNMPRPTLLLLFRAGIVHLSSTLHAACNQHFHALDDLDYAVVLFLIRPMRSYLCYYTWFTYMYVISQYTLPEGELKLQTKY